MAKSRYGRDIELPTEKTCVGCGETKPFDQFYSDVLKPTGHDYCTECLDKQTDFPHRELIVQYSPEELLREYQNVQKAKGKLDAVPVKNRIIWHYQHHFFEVERGLWEKPELRNKLIKNRIKYRFKTFEELTAREFLSGFKISGMHYGFSHFSPLWIKAFAEKYNPSCTYDPCGGWGHRLIGMGNRPYIYNDIDDRSCDGVRRIIEDFNIKNKVVYNNDSSTFTPEDTYDCVFTCPPYFNLENYTKSNTSHKAHPEYHDWLNVWWRNTIRRSTGKDGVSLFAFVVSNKYLEAMRGVCESEGFSLIELSPVGSVKVKSHFQKDSKQEFLLVFDTNKA